MDNLFGVLVAVMGVFILLLDFFAFVYRKLTEGIEMCWCFFGFVLFLLGVVPGLSAWTAAVPLYAYPAFFVFGISMVAIVFYLSIKLSQLIRKNQELAMHVSLLNQENESILEKLKEVREMERDEKTENTVCH